MNENVETVAGEMIPMEAPADDAQAAVIAAEELMQNLDAAGADGENAENTGDSGQPHPEGDGQEEQSKEDRFGRRIKAALASQRRQLFADLGGSEDEIRQILRDHRAAQLSRENPAISPEAAKIIVAEREKTAQAAENGPSADVVNAVQSLIEDGWTRDELTAFAKDETALAQINEEGVSVRRAALDYMRRAQQTPAQQTRRSIPTMRAATARGAAEVNQIENMTDEEFAAFSRRAQEAMMAGKKVRF